MNRVASRLSALLGTASVLSLWTAVSQAQQVAQAQMAQAAPGEIPEQVLVTGSLIHGTAAVGVPVTNLSPQDFRQTGALTTADLFRTVPQANVSPGPVGTQSGANIERATRVNLRGLDTGNGVRSLLMVDNMRFPPQGNGQCEIDPSIIPSLALDRIDVLVDGASAVYGSDAIGGVINLILKRGYDGAVTQLRYTSAEGGKNRYQAAQLWGRTWDGGDITLSYEWYDDTPIHGTAHSNFTTNFTPWGLENRTPLASAMPGIISTGAPATTFPGGFSAALGTACTNCFSIPHGTGANFNPINNGLGPTAASSAATLNWASFSTNSANNGVNGTRNEFNPYSIAWFDAAQQRNAATITVDQRLTRSISFTGEAFYSNRRAEYLNPANISPDSTNLLAVAVPTVNPYYPTGAPNNLRVNYTTVIENPSMTSAYELALRYSGGLQIELPGSWNGLLYYGTTRGTNANHVAGAVNRNAVSAALGWTMPAAAGIGTAPGFATWTKPATVPYLNLFCDASQFQCNSSTTLSYITGLRSFNQSMIYAESGAKFDGPLFAVPAGDVKAAVGVSWTTVHFSFVTLDNTGAATLVAPLLSDPRSRQVGAYFAQLNIPVFEEANAIPLFRKLELEASWRHDQYNDVGGTSNPKFGLNWMLSEDAGLTVRADWGTSFRAPFFGETSSLSNVNIQGWNLGALFPQSSNININCDAEAGSGADKLKASFGCGPNVIPAGISMTGGSNASAGLRVNGFNGGTVLKPEQSANYGVGFEFAPTAFLRGLDLQATWYQVKINSVLTSFGNPTAGLFNQGNRGFAFIVPTDLRAIDPTCTNNLTPQTCVTFQQMVTSLLTNPRDSVPVQAQTQIFWINDGGTLNAGWLKLQGIDWTASYDQDLGDFGAWNIGAVGTYYLHNYSQSLPGTPVDDQFHHDIASVGGLAQSGVASASRVRYRARLGWSNGPLSATVFMDYQSHFFHAQAAPPQVNFQCVAVGGTLPGGTLPCAISNYSNLEPPMYTFDLSLGYDTGDNPANDYLKHLGVQLVIQNITDKHPAFEYRISTGGGNPAAYDITKSDQGRTVSVILTKTW